MTDTLHPQTGSTPTAHTPATEDAAPAPAAKHATAPAHQAAHEQHDRIGPVFAGLIVTMTMAALGQTILSTALPTIIGELNGAEHMSWVITGFILASTIVMPVYGRISDMFGRRPILVTAILLFMLGSIIGGFAQDMTTLIIARAVQGLGGGGLMILSQAAMADIVPARDRGKYMGVFGAVFAVCSVAGPLVGGWLTDGPGWRWAFWANIPLALAAALTVAFFLRPHRRTGDHPRIDYLGMALIGAATTSLVLVCTWGGNTYAWNSPIILLLILATVVFAVAFAFAERYAAAPVLPGYLFKNRNFLLTMGSSIAVGMAMFGTLGYMPTYIQMVTGVTATEAGLLMSPMMLALLIFATVSGALVSRTGRYKGWPLTGLIVLAAGLVLISTVNVDMPIWVLCVFLFVVGSGIGMSMQILTLIVQNEFPARVVGTATAGNNYFRQVGATVGSAAVGSLFSERLVNGITERFAAFTAQQAQQAQQQGAGAGQAGAGIPQLDATSLTPQAVHQLPEPIRELVTASYNEALMPVILYLVPIVIVGAILIAFVKVRELATTVDTTRGAAERDAASSGAKS